MHASIVLDGGVDRAGPVGLEWLLGAVHRDVARTVSCYNHWALLQTTESLSQCSLSRGDDEQEEEKDSGG